MDHANDLNVFAYRTHPIKNRIGITDYRKTPNTRLVGGNCRTGKIREPLAIQTDSILYPMSCTRAV